MKCAGSEVRLGLRAAAAPERKKLSFGRAFSKRGANKESSSSKFTKLVTVTRVNQSIGMRLSNETAGFVDAVVAGSPAAQAGVSFNDKILEIQGVPVAGKTADEVIEAIKGAGETITLLLTCPHKRSLSFRQSISGLFLGRSSQTKANPDASPVSPEKESTVMTAPATAAAGAAPDAGAAQAAETQKELALSLEIGARCVYTRCVCI